MQLKTVEERIREFQTLSLTFVVGEGVIEHHAKLSNYYLASITQDRADIAAALEEALETKSVIELFPNADLTTPNEELADQVMYKEAYNEGIKDAQNIIRTLLESKN